MGRRRLASLADLGLGAQAAGADVEALRLAVDRHVLDVDVGHEDAIGPRRFALPAARVLVADIAAEGGALAADFTFCSHNARKLSKSRGRRTSCPAAHPCRSALRIKGGDEGTPLKLPAGEYLLHLF